MDDLAALARETKTVRLGILVSGNTYRHPAVLAKMTMTIDHLSGGRLEVGLGAGRQENEHVAYGIPFHSAKERAERLGEALELVKRLWTGRPAAAALHNRLVPGERLVDAALEMAEVYAAKAPVAVQMIKQSINALTSALDHSVMRMEADQFLLTATTDDRREAIDAHLFFSAARSRAWLP